MPLEAVMPAEPVMAAEATVWPAEGVPTPTAVAPAAVAPATAVAPAPVRVHGRAADNEQCCDQCGQPN
jgi:hypothetical protein